MSYNITEIAQTIYNALVKNGATHMGACGLIGNLQAESGLIPIRKQGDFTSDYSTSQDYTDGVNNGSISEETFVNDSIGYGLAQWTYYTRKQALYTKKVNDGYDSIGNLQLAIDYLLIELCNSYADVWNVLCTSDDLRTCSDKVLHDFESPKDQSESVEIERYNLGLAWTSVLSGGSSGGGGGDEEEEEDSIIGKTVTVNSNLLHGKKYGKSVYGQKFRRFYSEYIVTAESGDFYILSKNGNICGKVKKEYVKKVGE